MGSEQNKLKSRLSALNASLDELEEKLEPLMAQTLPESVVSLETLQQAKLQVALPYLVYGLIFIYLKTKGIDPKTHPVVAELDRVRQYFDKIKTAEDPAKRKTAVDKAAATRFIKHAITQLETNEASAKEAGPSHIRFTDIETNPTSASTAPIPVRVTSKMKARARYEKEMKELGSEEEGELQVYDDVEDNQNLSPKEDSLEARPPKRRRPEVDPFAGYGSDHETRNKASKKGKTTAEASSTPAAGDSSAGTAGHFEEASAAKDKKKAKKAKKKAKKAASEAKTASP
ncbi:C1D-domain-containing protein [Neolentinus lepideus HHB14362 ss-1]|uniref:Exosome complex protein n=1 Tax=Neolentinus lepideus HHB14362 ss-1 TaxID=1314782 RepID=A0A165WB77_9AGAM|nr:C1D-domain-containing protein [Neolentinus lepideus HHB14362 ss-1]